MNIRFGLLAIAGFLSAAAAPIAMAAGRPAATASLVWGFSGGIDGGVPASALIADNAGALYGTTAQGGANSFGTVFKLTPPTTRGAWTLTTLWTFNGRDEGGEPFASLIADAAGNLYGTASVGGVHQGGTVFKLTPPLGEQTAWTETTLWSFNTGIDGGRPLAPVVADAAGTLYGVTSVGGKLGHGTAFRLTPPVKGTAWAETTLWRFNGTRNGGVPIAGLLLGQGGVLVGANSQGGGMDNGTVFSLTPPKGGGVHWALDVIWTFTGQADGSYPAASLIADGKGRLHGTAAYGGANNSGTVYELTPPASGQTAWTQTTLYAFTGGADGQYPEAPLIADATGTLFGTTYGYATTAGSVFSLAPPSSGSTWTESTLYTVVKPDGLYPHASLTPTSGGLFTTTAAGGIKGATKFQGTVIKLTGTGYVP